MPYYARRVTASVKYNNKDISTDINDSLKSISYTDNLSGSADDIEIKLEDRANIWSSDWLPEKGATLDVSWTAASWETLASGENSLRVGLFEIDEISCSFSPSEVSIKAISIPDDNTLRGTEHTRSWEKVTLKKVCQDIADAAEMELVYEPEKETQLDRAEQTEESDLAFLLKLCNDNGYALKICNKQIVVFDEAKYEEADATITIVKPGTEYTAENGMTYINDILSANFKSKTREIYKACHVKYQKSKKKELIEYTFEDPNKTEGKTLQVTQEVADIAEAEKLAKKKLREKNSEEVTGNFSCYGNFALLAATTINVQGFGKFDGKYIITKASHTIGGGYT